MARKREEEKKDPLDYVRYYLEYRVSTINGIPVERWPGFSNISFGTHKVRETRKDPQEVQRVYNEMWDGSGEGPLKGREDHYLKPDSRYSLGPEAKGNPFNSLFFDNIIGEAVEDSDDEGNVRIRLQTQEIILPTVGSRRAFELFDRMAGSGEKRREIPLEIQRRLNQSGRLH
jgi:hypothetical protein